MEHHSIDEFRERAEAGVVERHKITEARAICQRLQSEFGSGCVKPGTVKNHISHLHDEYWQKKAQKGS
jgi:hypothetical protein